MVTFENRQSSILVKVLGCFEYVDTFYAITSNINIKITLFDNDKFFYGKNEEILGIISNIKLSNFVNLFEIIELECFDIYYSMKMKSINKIFIEESEKERLDVFYKSLKNYKNLFEMFFKIFLKRVISSSDIVSVVGSMINFIDFSKVYLVLYNSLSFNLTSLFVL